MRSEINLFEKSITELEESKRKTEIAIKARQTIKNLVKVICQAGGAITEEELAATTLGDLAIVAAQNNLVLSLQEWNDWYSRQKNSRT